MVFVSRNKIRMHDIDMAGILYFPRQFRFVHEALEEFMESEGYPFHEVFYEKNFLFVIVHCEADFFAPLKLGDAIEVHLFVENIGTTSFTLFYEIFRDDDGKKTGTAKTVHVALDRHSRKKTPIPDRLVQILNKYPPPLT